MFKSQRQNHKSSKSGERVDFNFSNFQALQVPKGWDRLFLSIISAESGKTIAKLGKALVRNGSCQWTETLSESVWVSKESEECVFKFIVSMGSSRSGILGEATINVSSYRSSKMSSPVSLPLRKCNYGTILQVKIQCLASGPNIRPGSPGYIQEKDEDIEYHKTGASNNSRSRGSKISSTRGLDVTSHQGDQNSWELNCSVSGSNDVSNFVENSTKTDKDLNSNGWSTRQRHFGASSKIGSPRDNYPVDDCSFSSQSSSNSSSRNSRMDLQGGGKESGASSPKNAGSNHLLEAAESTIEELRAEAKMWERNARKLMTDLDMMRSEFLDQSKKQADLVMELSAAYAEQGGMKKEIERLKLMLEDATQKQRKLEDSPFQTEGLTQIQKELESEIKYQQQSNANLSLQLKRSQESNIELVSILQELEQTIEQQKIEIENLSAQQLNHTDVDSSAEQNLVENKHILFQLQQLRESEKALEINVEHLEKALHEKMNELENEQRLNSQSLLDVEREYKYQLRVKDEEIAKLEAKVQKSGTGVIFEDKLQDNGSNSDLIKEIEILREKVYELERDCNELTDENLELLLKIKDSKNQSIEKCESFSSASSDLQPKSASAQSDVSDTEPQMYDLELKTKMKEVEQWARFEVPELFSELLKQLEMAFHHLMKPMPNIPSEVGKKCEFLLENLVNLTKNDSPNSKVLTESIVKYFLELNCVLENRIAEFEQIFKRSEIEIQRRNETIAEAQKNLEDHILKVQQHESSKAELEAACQNLLKELSQKESEKDKLLADLLVREEQTSFHISAKEVLERRSADLEVERQKLKSKIKQLEEENLLLQGSISSMDGQMRHLANEKESCHLQLKKSESHAMNLQGQIKNLESEMEINMANLNHDIKVMQAQLMETQRQCECLSAENQDLQASTLRLTKERNTLQNLNKELQRKELELHEHCEQMTARLAKSEKAFFDCTKKVEALEENLNSILEDFSLKEKSLNSELDDLLQECRKYKEKIIQRETVANQMHLEKSAEVENLGKEVDNLRKQISAVHAEKEKVEFEDSREISSLLADKEKLESALKEVQSKLGISENELITLRAEFELKVQSLTSDLATSKQSHVILMTNHEKLMKQLATYRTTEDKLKTAVNNLELKLTVSEYENQQLREDNASKKIQFQKISDLQDEVSVLKNKVEEIRFEKEKLEASLHTVTADYNGLNAEKDLCTEKLLSLQEAMADYENCKQKANSLEKKLQQMESDLSAKETLCAQRAHLQNELNEVREANKQYQQKICQLEEEKLESLQKAQALEMNSVKKYASGRKGSIKYVVEDTDAHPVEVTRELGETWEADKTDRIQLESFPSKEQSSETIYSKKSISDEQKLIRERFERTKSSLESELRDLRERYLQMSLKYAEVEADREDLVMKLKSAKSGKRWFA